MLVRQLVGPQAGHIVEMPFSAAEACISNGTAGRLTDAEIIEAGLTVPEEQPKAPPTVPEGFYVRVRPDVGFDLFVGEAPAVEDPVKTDDWVGTGVQGPEPLHNLAAVRDAAQKYLDENSTEEGVVEVPDNFRDLSAKELKELVGELGLMAGTKTEMVAAIEAHLAESGAN